MSLSPRIKDRLEKLLENTLDLALKRRARLVVDELSLKEGDIILDAGCGDGYYLHLLSNLGIPLRLVGIDSDEKALESARKNLSDKKIKLTRADLRKKLPFKPQSFDKIILSEVLEHLTNDTGSLKEIKRVLKRGGVLVITVPNHNYSFLWDPINWILEHVLDKHINSGFWAGIWNQHIRLYRPKEIKKAVEGVGFKIDTLQSLTYWSLPFNHHIVNLGARILATKTGPRSMIQGADKFSKRMDKSIPVYFFFLVSNLLDKLNDLWVPSDLGVSILAKATRAK